MLFPRYPSFVHVNTGQLKQNQSKLNTNTKIFPQIQFSVFGKISELRVDVGHRSQFIRCRDWKGEGDTTLEVTLTAGFPLLFKNFFP